MKLTGLNQGNGYDENLQNNVHGVKRFRADGSIEMKDGRYVALVHISPINTMKTSKTVKEDISNALARGYDEKLNTLGADIYSTTREPDVEKAIGEFEERLRQESFKNPDGKQREMLESLVEWYKKDDIPGWEDRLWSHFAVVSVDDGDIPDSGDDEVNAARKQEKLDERVETVASAVNTVSDLTATRASPEMHIAVVSDFWSDTVPSNKMKCYDGTEDSDGHTYSEYALSPGKFDYSRNGVHINDKSARTYWIADYPQDPDPHFLEEIYNMTGVDVDIKIHVDPVNKDDALARLKKKIGTIGAVGMEHEEEGDIEADDVKRDIQYYYDFRDELRETTAQAWEMSTYVTIYADDDDALEKAGDTLEHLENMEIAKDAALDDISTDLVDMLKETPAKTLPVMPRTRQREAFISSSPLGEDVYDEATNVSKKRLVPGKSIGAMFPFSGGRVQERGGFFWGRNQQNASQFKPDPYQRASPHMITMGQTRSGKTYSASMAAARWYAQSDDHQLIVADTQAGFKEVTELLGGERIVIDGRNDINPMEISAVSENRREQIGEEADPFGLKVEEVKQFILGVLESQKVDDVGDYSSIVEEAIVETYNNRGIYQNDLDSHARESPRGIGEFIDTLERWVENTEESTFTNHEAEVGPRKKNIGKLLNKLGPFKEGNKYSNFMDGSGESLLSDDVDMAYLDMQQMTDRDSVEKSMMLQLMLSQVSQKVKASDKKTVFMIDEAHILLHSPKMVNWLQRSAREWARYNACMWFISQSPREFVQRSENVSKGGENARRTIVDQCSMIQFFRTPMGDENDESEEILSKFGLNEKQQQFVKDEATPGRADEDYTQCLVRLRDKPGWFQVHVESTPFEDKILSNADDNEMEDMI